MVKPREKVTNSGEIPQELYEQAANAVINKKAKVRTTARQYGNCSRNKVVTSLQEQ